MKILNPTQIRAADAYTIANKPISSTDLMERAARICVNWIVEQYDTSYSFQVFCGLGNNGGDGLVIARCLHQLGYRVDCYVLRFSPKTSPDFEVNEQRLSKLLAIQHIHGENDFPTIKSNDNIVIDAIFGSGLNRPLKGWLLSFVQHLNQANTNVVSIDIPSGLFCEDNSDNNINGIVRATHTLSLHLPKLALLLPENAERVGEWHLLPIGLDDTFIEAQATPYQYLTKKEVAERLKARGKFSHKGTFGHVLVVAGSKGKVGAAVLATSACLRSGAGLVSVYAPKCAYQILQIAVPEAMVIENEGETELQGVFDLENKTIAVGPGVGTSPATVDFLHTLLKKSSYPLVIDADAINILGQHKDWLALVPKYSIFTPHPKEFTRLVGEFSNDTEKLKMQQSFAERHQCYLILKGAHTAIACPDGKIYFNSTGNAGMATGGSGDVLTGILAGLLAQGYSSEEACVLGVFLHGLSGDIAAQKVGQEALIARDLVENLGAAFQRLKM